MTAPHCPTCHDDVSVPYDYGCWRCQACGAVFAVYDDDDLAADNQRFAEDYDAWEDQTP